ncbi:MAG: hypothetical protein GQ582_09555 [Methyloprofundus sp.]|nr:hypothetical protein [Methyloprofundus sp.]
MPNKNIILSSLFCIGTLSSPALLASATTLNEWGTTASVVSGDCIGNSCSPFGLLLSGMTQEHTAGGINELSAVTGDVIVAQGTGKASATVTAGALATPILKTQASSANDAWLGASAFAIQGYEFTGSVAETISLDILFDGTLTNPDADTATGFGVGMYLFTAEQIGFADLAADPYQVLGALALTAQSSLPSTQIYEFETSTAGFIEDTGLLSILLNPGEQFYLAGGVISAAGGTGAIADAYNTLTVEFSAGSENLLAVASAVPAPSTSLLLLSALLGWGSYRKYKLA